MKKAEGETGPKKTRIIEQAKVDSGRASLKQMNCYNEQFSE